MKYFIKHERFYAQFPGTLEALRRAEEDPEFVAYLDSYLLTQNKAKELGYGDPLPRGGKTTVSAWMGNHYCGEAVAYCSTRENFCKRLGRTIAYGRLRKSLQLV